MPFRFNAKTFFFTYPQVADSVTKENAVSRLRERHALEWVISCEEAHEDGGRHIHMCGKFVDKVNIMRADYFDFVGGKHGDYRSMRKQKECVKYVTKDGNYLADGIDVEDFLSGKRTLRDSVAKMVLEGKSDREIIDEEPGYFMEKQRQIEMFRSIVRAVDCECPDHWICPLVMPEACPGWHDVRSWLLRNLLVERPRRQKQLWLQGPTSVGKTMLWSFLEKTIRVYIVAAGEQWMEDYDDNLYDLVVFDEYVGGKPVSMLNAFVEGARVKLSRRGRPPYEKTKNIPVMICSNKSIEECYHGAQAQILEALKDRFEEVFVYNRGIDFEEGERIPPVMEEVVDPVEGHSMEEEVVEREEEEEEEQGDDSDDDWQVPPMNQEEWFQFWSDDDMGEPVLYEYDSDGILYEVPFEIDGKIDEWAEEEEE